MVDSGVKVTVDKVPDVLKGLRFLDKNRVLIGIPSAKAGRRDGPISNAAIGFIMENGAPEVNIPARPFLVPGVKNIVPWATPQLKKAGKAVLDGEWKLAEKIMDAIGLKGQRAVKQKIRIGPFLPLSERTLAARRARGVKRTKPLIDTAQMLNAVTYVIRRLSGWL